MGNKDFLIKLTDGGLINYEDDVEHHSGCPTCDYGSEYINNITLYLTKYKVTVVLNKMYDYLISQGDIIKWFLSGYDYFKVMTEVDFINWFKIKIAKEIYDYYYPIYSNEEKLKSDNLTYEELEAFIENEQENTKNNLRATDNILREFSVEKNS